METTEAPPPAAAPTYGPRLPGPLKRLKRWLVNHHMTLMAIKDTPHSIALGSAIGIFFGFTPLWSMKTLLSIAVAWLFRSNKVAAAIAVTLHDIILPVMPAIFLWEYKIGFRVLHGSLPHRISVRHMNPLEYLHPPVFMKWIWPMLVGSIILGVPIAVTIYFVMRLLIRRAREPQKAA